MDSTSCPPWIRRITCFVMSGLAFVVIVKIATQWNALSFAQAAPATAAEPKHDEDEHARFEAILRKTMDGPVDVYFDVTEVESDKPLLAGVQFDGLIDVTGKHSLRFSDGTGQQWLIDPDTVLTFRIHGKRSANAEKRE